MPPSSSSSPKARDRSHSAWVVDSTGMASLYENLWFCTAPKLSVKSQCSRA